MTAPAMKALAVVPLLCVLTACKGEETKSVAEDAFWHGLNLTEDWKRIDNPEMDELSRTQTTVRHSGTWVCEASACGVDARIIVFKHTGQQVASSWQDREEYQITKLLDANIFARNEPYWASTWHYQYSNPEHASSTTIPMRWTRLDTGYRSKDQARTMLEEVVRDVKVYKAAKARDAEFQKKARARYNIEWCSQVVRSERPFVEVASLVSVGRCAQFRISSQIRCPSIELA